RWHRPHRGSRKRRNSALHGRSCRKRHVAKPMDRWRSRLSAHSQRWSPTSRPAATALPAPNAARRTKADARTRCSNLRNESLPKQFPPGGGTISTYPQRGLCIHTINCLRLLCCESFNKRCGVASMLIYQCPKYGKTVRTNIETTENEV